MQITMKNIKNILTLLALIVLIATSCKKYEYQYTYDGDNYVQFLNSSGTYFVLEGDTITFSVQFQIIGDVADADITMPVEFLDSAEIDGNIVKSTIVPGEKGVTAEQSVTISAGDFTGALTVSGTYDSLEFGEIDSILIQLNDGTVASDSYNNIYILKIQKYYPYLQEEFPGDYQGDYLGYILGATVPASPGLTIEAGEDYYDLVITSGFYQEQIDAWGETWTDGPYSITIHMNDEDATNFVVEIPSVQYIGTTNDEWDYWAQPYPAPGSFNAASKELDIVFYVSVYGGDQPPQDIGEYIVTLSDKAAARILEGRNRRITEELESHK